MSENNIKPDLGRTATGRIRTRPLSEATLKAREANARRLSDPASVIRTQSASAKKGNGNIAINVAKMTSEEIAQRQKNQYKRPLRPAQLAEMEALWESGEVSLRELAERFDLTQTSVSRYMSLNEVTKGERAEEHKRMVRERIAEELAGDAGERAKLIKKKKDEYLTLLDIPSKLANNEVQTCRSKGLPLQSIYGNLKSIKELLNIYAGSRNEIWKILDVDEFESKHVEDDIPELLISQLTATDIEKMRQEQLQSASMSSDLLPLNLGDETNDVVEEGAESDE